MRAVDNVSFDIPVGTAFSLVGESGCGKPTLARVIAGLDLRCSGSLVFGRPADGRVQRTQMIFQDPYASLIPRWRVGDAVAELITFQKLRLPTEVKQRVEGLLVRAVPTAELFAAPRSRSLAKAVKSRGGNQRQPAACTDAAYL